VTIERIEPNRKFAFSLDVLAPYAVDPGFLRSAAEQETNIVLWEIDDERTSSLLMGQALEYEIANVVDPNFTVVAKIRKSLLSAR
jgi:hypothetical protein